MISTIPVVTKTSCALLTLALATVTSASPLLQSESCNPKDLLVISFTTDRYPRETSWKLKSQQDGKTLLSKGIRKYKKKKHLYKDTLCLTELQDQCFSFQVYDGYGDGLSECYKKEDPDKCGSYVVTLNDEIVVAGGRNNYHQKYWKKETNQFCVGDASLHPSVSPSVSPSSAPTSSLAPSAFPSTSPSFDCRQLLSIQVKTDSYSYETSWNLKSQDGNIILSKSNGDYQLPGHFYEDILCLADMPPQCFVFEIFDNGGDGISEYYCGSSYDYYKSLCGSYELILNKEVVVSSSGTESYDYYWRKQTYQFCVGDASVHPSVSPSVSPSFAPTSSLAPSAFPSTSPSFDCDQLLSIQVKTDSYSYETSWNLKSQDGDTILSKLNGDYQLSRHLYEDFLCLADMPPQCFVFEIFDSAGDGLSEYYCGSSDDYYKSTCGSYKLILNKEVVVVSSGIEGYDNYWSGSYYWQKKTHQFCTGGADPPPTLAPTTSQTYPISEIWTYAPYTQHPSLSSSPTHDYPSWTIPPYSSYTTYPDNYNDDYVTDDYYYYMFPTFDPTLEPTTLEPTTPVPSSSPTTPEPSSSPTFSCTDRTDLEYKDDTKKNCDWVGKKNTKTRCKKDWKEEGKKLYDYCPLTCSEVGLGNCV